MVILSTCRGTQVRKKRTQLLGTQMPIGPRSENHVDGIQEGEAFFTNVVPCKGTSHGNAAQALAHKVLSAAITMRYYRCDTEPSIIEVKHKSGTYLTTEIVQEEVPVREQLGDHRRVESGPTMHCSEFW